MVILKVKVGSFSENKELSPPKQKIQIQHILKTLILDVIVHVSA